MTRNWLVSICFITLLLIVFYQIFLIFSPFLQAIFWAAFLAFAFYPVYNYLLKILKQHEVLAAFLTTLAILLVVTPFVIVVVFKLSGQVVDFFQILVSYVKEGRLQELIEKIRSYAFIRNIESELLSFKVVEESVSQWILNSAKQFGNFTVEQIGILTKNIVFFIMGILLTFFLTLRL